MTLTPTRPAPAALRAALVVASALAATSAIAQDAPYPVRPIQLVVTTAVGGTGDLVARTVAERLAEALRQPVIVENQTAGNGNVAVGQVIKAQPDGHTLILMADSTLTINPHLYKNLPFNAAEDLAPVSIAAKMPMALLGGTGLKANNVQEMIKLARENPGKLNYASTGLGTHLHIGFELFKLRTNTDIVHVPYRGNTGAMADLMGGRLDLVLIGQPAVASQTEGGKVKILGLAAETRSKLLPNVPTLIESGVPDYQVSAWYGLLAPAKTPPAILERLATEMKKLGSDARFVGAINAQGLEVIASTPDEMRASVKSDSAKWGEVIRLTGTTIPQ